MKLSSYSPFFINNIDNIIYVTDIGCIFSKRRILERLDSKLLKFFMHTSLAEAFIQEKSQGKIRKYSFAANVGVL
jgi:hypothetical protein